MLRNNADAPDAHISSLGYLWLRLGRHERDIFERDEI